MAALSTIVTVAAVTVAAGAGIYAAEKNASVQNEAIQESRRQREEDIKRQDTLLAQQKKEAADMKQAETATVEANRSREIMRNRQRALAGGGGTRSGTILTSPLGVQGASPASGKKTLLGQ